MQFREDTLTISMSTWINDQIYRVDTHIDKGMLEMAQCPKQVIEAAASSAYSQLIDKLGILI